MLTYIISVSLCLVVLFYGEEKEETSLTSYIHVAASSEHNSDQTFDNISTTHLIAIQEQNISHYFRDHFRYFTKIRTIFSPNFSTFPRLTKQYTYQGNRIDNSEAVDYYIFALRKIRI